MCFKRKIELPPEGSIYTHDDRTSPYFGMTGIVEHHADKKSFMIFTGTSWLTCIKPKKGKR